MVECELCAKLSPDMEQSAARTAAQAGGVMQCRECGRVYDTSVNRIEALSAKLAEAEALLELQNQDIGRLREALAKWDRLIEHQYTGSREAMSAMHDAAQFGCAALGDTK